MTPRRGPAGPCATARPRACPRPRLVARGLACLARRWGELCGGVGSVPGAVWPCAVYGLFPEVSGQPLPGGGEEEGNCKAEYSCDAHLFNEEGVAFS